MSLEYHDLPDTQTSGIVRFHLNARTVLSIPLKATPETLAEPKHIRLEVLLSTDTEFQPIEMGSLFGAACIFS